jgi:hypothetical protein
MGVKMAMYTFVAPILPGKTETWLKYTQELKATRWNEFIKALQTGGVRSAQARLQRTPNGDYSVVWFEGGSPTAFFKLFMESNEPVIKWFREKILIECEGADRGGQPPTQNELILDFAGQPVKTYEESRKR